MPCQCVDKTTEESADAHRVQDQQHEVRLYLYFVVLIMKVKEQLTGCKITKTDGEQY